MLPQALIFDPWTPALAVWAVPMAREAITALPISVIAATAAIFLAIALRQVFFGWIDRFARLISMTGGSERPAYPRALVMAGLVFSAAGMAVVAGTGQSGSPNSPTTGLALMTLDGEPALRAMVQGPVPPIPVNVAPALMAQLQTSMARGATSPDRFLSANESSGPTPNLLTKVAGHLSADDPLTAAGLLERARRRDPENPLIWAKLNDVYDRLGPKVVPVTFNADEQAETGKASFDLLPSPPGTRDDGLEPNRWATQISSALGFRPAGSPAESSETRITADEAQSAKMGQQGAIDL